MCGGRPRQDRGQTEVGAAEAIPDANRLSERCPSLPSETAACQAFGVKLSVVKLSVDLRAGVCYSPAHISGTNGGRKGRIL
jgi:hypothetical protein